MKVKRFLVPLLILLSIVSYLPSTVQAALGEPYTVYGMVLNQDEDPLPGVYVKVTNNATGDFIETTSNSIGQYQVNLGNLNQGWNQGDEINVYGEYGSLTDDTTLLVSGNRYQQNLTLDFIEAGIELIAFISTAPYAFVGESVTFDGSYSWSSGDITNWTWDFGDGQGGFGAIVEHVYQVEGNYNLSLVVSDGLTTSGANVTFNVTELLWEGPESFNVTIGQEKWVNISGYVLMGSTLSTNDSRVSWVSTNNTLYFKFFPGDGNITFSLQIVSGNRSYTTSLDIIIFDPYIEPTIGIIIERVVQGLVIVSATIEDGISPFTYRWNWGDNTFITDCHTLCSHNYQESGVYEITLTVSDERMTTKITTEEVNITLPENNDTIEEPDGSSSSAVISQEQAEEGTDLLLEMVLFLMMAFIFLFIIRKVTVPKSETFGLHLISAIILSLLITITIGWVDIWTQFLTVLGG
jgi:PKD repeat protein